MMKIDAIKPFLNKPVIVQVPHRYNDGKTFGYFGTVIQLFEDSLLLQNREGETTLIRFSQVLEIREEHQ